MVSFSASKTLAALLLCFPLVALQSRTCTIIWGQRLTTEARLPGQQPQTDPQEESGPGGETFREPNGFLSPGMRVKASICSKKLVYFLRTRRPPAPPGLIQPTLHILLLWELKINRYALKNTQTHLPSTPLPEFPRARDPNLSGPESKMQTTSSSAFHWRLLVVPKAPSPGAHPSHVTPAASEGRL